MANSAVGNWVAWIATVICAGAAAYFGAYLGKRAERRAMKETLESVEGRVADITEAARLRWSRKSEVCAVLYGRLVMAERQFRNCLSMGTTSTDEAVERLRERCVAFDDHFAQNALFLPKDTKAKISWVAEQFAKVFNATTLLRPVKAELSDNETESVPQQEVRMNHYKMKAKHGERFKREGDISMAIAEIEASLRCILDLQ